MQLIRENGYINLNEFFFNKYGINVNEITDLRNVITLEQLGNRSKFWFDLDDRRVMFKEQYANTLEAYAELILSLMIEKMQIPYLSAAKYDLAVLTYKDKKILGVITENFKKEGIKYYTGSDIIVDVYNRYIKNDIGLIKELGLEGLDEKSLLNKLNSLEELWLILTNFFRNKPYAEDNVTRLMSSLANLYMFDALTIQGDRHSDNWMVGIDENGKAFLTPLYDNSNALNLNRQKTFDSLVNNFNSYKKLNEIKKPRLYKKILGQVYHPSTLLTVELRDNLKDKKNCLDVLEDFIVISDSQYKEILGKMISFIKDGRMNEVYEEVEKKIGQPLPDKLKYYMAEIFKVHISEIEKRFDLEEWKVKGGLR